ncbi:sensor histidine kinase [Falsirhodobacter algicola]|uniref:histidine kinase n=1 Tax=Falsirhodobacter algicola TaxID=2692330 RepID=A0A8J8MTL7_9RHOB|nr:sensor histidine kinase [Falsirhodobacter algicola]QUS36018.1 histidine kinase [Falsirhodobacter algicola]
MTTTKARLHRLSGTLGFRIAFLLAVALLPLAMVSAVQTIATLKEARARSEAALMGETMRAAEADLLLVQRARGAAQALSAALVPLLSDPIACSSALSSFVGQANIYTLAAFVDVNGRLTCASRSVGTSIAEVPSFQDLQRDPRPMVYVSYRPKISAQPVVVVSTPVYGLTNELLGFVSLSLPHQVLQADTAEHTATQPPELLTFNSEGEVLTSALPARQVVAMLPEGLNLADLASTEDMSFTARTGSGQLRVYSVVPILPDALFAMGSWPVDDDDVWYMRALPNLFLPLAMWIASLVVAFLAVERLVTRHVRSLRQAMTGFGDGKRIIGRIPMAGAPTELRELSETFAHMTDTILHDEAEMEDMIHQKEVLLREVHHRVKNNLQLIASIMNMQIRQARSAEAKSLMKGLQERVMSLATIHRGLYQTSGLTDIRADELLTDITRQVVRLATGPGRHIALSTSFADMRLTPDQAVPLSLLLTEALANALKYAGSHDGNPTLEVRLFREGAVRAALVVTNSLGPRSAGTGNEGTGLGSQLLIAFAQQIGGRVDISQDEVSYALRVDFEVEPLSTGEARISGGDREH